MKTYFVTYRGKTSDRFDREHFINTHLPLSREIGEPLGMVSIEAFFPAGPATDILASVVLVFRDEQAQTAVFTSPRFQELVNDIPNYTNLAPESSLVAHLSA